LETRYIKDPVVLYFADGSTAEVCGHGDFLLRLLVDICSGGELRPEQAKLLDLVRRSVGALEPGGARMIEVLHLLEGPVETQDSALVDGSDSLRSAGGTKWPAEFPDRGPERTGEIGCRYDKITLAKVGPRRPTAMPSTSSEMADHPAGAAGRC